MKNINCKIPNPKNSPEKLFMHFKGKGVIPLVAVLASWTLIFAHYLVDINQLWTLAILAFFLVYALIPTRWYMQNVYRFFIASFIGVFTGSVLFYYIGWLFFIELGIYFPTSLFVISTFIIYFVIFGMELYQSRNKIDIYKRLIEKSVVEQGQNKPIFSIAEWIKGSEESPVDTGGSFAIRIFLYLSIPIVLVGFFAGSPLISAKVLMDNSQDFILYSVISMFFVAFGVFLVSPMSKELLKIIALKQLEDQL